MAEAYRVLALICARSGSRGLRHKNVRKLGGVPLLVRAVELARASQRKGESWRVVVSTDSAHYARLARQAGAEVPGLRPAHLAAERSRLIDAVLYTLDAVSPPGEQSEPHAVLLLSATTPLTAATDVRRGIELFRHGGGVSVVSVREDPFADSWRFDVTRGVLTRLDARGGYHQVGRRQEAPPRAVLNGAIYIGSPRWLREHGQFVVPGQTLPLWMPPERCLDIETADDLALAQWRHQRQSKPRRPR